MDQLLVYVAINMNVSTLHMNYVYLSKLFIICCFMLRFTALYIPISNVQYKKILYHRHLYHDIYQDIATQFYKEASLDVVDSSCSFISLILLHMFLL